MALSYTYSPPFVAGSKDYVRWRVGDTNGNPQWFLSDEEIEGLIALYPVQIDEVAAQCCENIASQCAQLAVMEQSSKVKQQFADRGAHFMLRAQQIRDGAMPAPGEPAYPGSTGGEAEIRGDRDYDRYIERNIRGRPHSGEYGGGEYGGW
jgi:hypothetical protein